MNVKGLDGIIGLSVVHPVFQRTRPNDENDSHTGWAFADPEKTPALKGPSGLGSYSSKGSIPDTVNKAKFVRDLYDLCTFEKTRYTVPLLWDKKSKTIVSNESADIVRMFNDAFEDLVPSKLDLYPEELRAEIDELNEWVYNDISNGVYKCGFASSQTAYDEAVEKGFAGLDRAENILAEHRFLVGDQFTEADLKLFPTLVRFDEVYAVHFKANKKLIQQYPNLSSVRPATNRRTGLLSH
jgi:putative glutathione S-transferase